MNKKRKPIQRPYNNYKELVYSLMCSILFLGMTYSTECLELDLLNIPARIAERPENSTLMDVKKVNSHLVTVGERGTILYSDQTCAGWLQADVPVSITLTAVYFTNSSKGWAVGHDGVVLHTENGGENWIKQLDGIEINKLVYDQLVKVIEDKKNLLAAKKENLTIEELEKLEREIEDFGFFLSDAEMGLEEGPTRPLMDLWFKNDQEGIIVGAFGMILETKDGGKSWVPILDRIENPNGYHYYGITRCGNNLFIAGEMGLLFRSIDFGQTWETLTSPYEGTFFGVVGNPEGNFVTTFGLRGNICFSRDGGESWQHKSLGRSSINGGTWLSSGKLCLVAMDGSIYISSDDGETFKVLSQKIPSAIAVAQSNSDELAVVGLNGIKKVNLDK